MRSLRFALFGTGFWSRYQLAAWRELQGVECVALYNRTRSKAQALAAEFGINAVYDDAEALLAREDLDFVDIATSPDLHCRFVLLAAARKLAVVCQKPMAPSLAECERMVAACQAEGVPFFIHENWRWQASIRCLKQVLNERPIGELVRARISLTTGFDVFANQPALREMDRFILLDLGSHLLDASRFLFGEPHSLYCRIRRIRRDIRGEDVATAFLEHACGMSVTCEMSYAGSHVENDSFPETLIFVEGAKGTIAVTKGFQIRITVNNGTRVISAKPEWYGWADPAYLAVQASIVPCHRNLLAGLRGCAVPETTGEDNLRTMRLVFAAYGSAENGGLARV